MIFELHVQATVRADGSLVLKGPEVQGPPAGRFVYINAGTYAGVPTSPWGRRAKVPLGRITVALVEAARTQPSQQRAPSRSLLGPIAIDDDRYGHQGEAGCEEQQA